MMAAPVLSELIAEVEFLLRALEIVQAEGEPPRAWAERVEGLDRAVRTLQRDQLLLEAAQLGAELLQWTRDHVLPAECSEPEPVDSWESLVEALLGMEAILGDLSSREPELPIVEPLLQQLESMVLSPSDLPESPICCSLSPALWEGMESSDQHNLMRTLDEVSATVSVQASTAAHSAGAGACPGGLAVQLHPDGGTDRPGQHP